MIETYGQANDIARQWVNEIADETPGLSFDRERIEEAVNNAAWILYDSGGVRSGEAYRVLKEILFWQ